MKYARVRLLSALAVCRGSVWRFCLAVLSAEVSRCWWRVMWRFPALSVMHVISSEGGVIGALAVGVADCGDDEADSVLVESGERVVEVDGDAVGDAGGQPQYPVLAAAAGQEPGLPACDDRLPVDVGHFGDAVGQRGAGADEAGEVAAAQPSGADDQVAGGFERVEPGGTGAESICETLSVCAVQGAGRRRMRHGRYPFSLTGTRLRQSQGMGSGASRGGGGQPANAGGLLDFAAQPGDLVVLGGDPGQCPGLEAGELGDDGVLSGQAFGERGGAGFHPADLGVARVGLVAVLNDGGQFRLEFLA